jgi:foldase protein PrsA
MNGKIKNETKTAVLQSIQRWIKDMNNLIKKAVARILAICMVFLSLTGCASVPEDTKIVLTTGLTDNEIFRINTQICEKPEAMVYLTNLQNKYEKIYGNNIWNTKLTDSTLEDRLKSSVLEELEQIKIMNLMAAKYHVSLSSQEEQQVQQAASKYYSSLSPYEVKSLGVSLKSIEDMYREYEIANEVYDTIIKGVNPEISDDEARIITVEQIGMKTYREGTDGKRSEFTDEEKKAVSDKMEEALQKAHGGEDFDTLIGEYSNIGDSKISFGHGEKSAAYEQAAFNLATGEISSVIQTADGYYIIKCTSTFDKEETKTNKEKILEKRKSTAFSKEYNAFEKTVTEERNNKVWDAIHFVHDDKIVTSDFFSVFDSYF